MKILGVKNDLVTDDALDNGQILKLFFEVTLMLIKVSSPILIISLKYHL